MPETLAARYEREIARIVEQLRARFAPERILLFGSAARGELREGSDIDLIVVVRTEQRWLDRTTAARAALDTDLPVDVVVLTPQEFAERSGPGHPSFRAMLAGAKVVYDVHAA